MVSARNVVAIVMLLTVITRITASGMSTSAQRKHETGKSGDLVGEHGAESVVKTSTSVCECASVDVFVGRGSAIW